MKVLLTHGYFMEEDEKEKEILRPYPPLGILYISAYLKSKGIPALVFDTTFSSEQTLKAYLIEQSPDVICFYVNLMTKLKVLTLVQWIRSEPSLQKAKIVLGGPDITYNTLNYLKAGADVVVKGEGEETTLELVEVFRKATPLEAIAGIAFLKDGQEIVTAPRQKIKELDELPLPDRAAINISRYLETWKQKHGSAMISISTQRGCPYTCKWCSTAVYGQSYRRRSPEKVVVEIEQLLSTYDCDTFWFVDDVFTVSHKWLQQFTELVEQRGLKFRYECISRADRMNSEVIDWLKRSGCFKIWIGAESGSQKIIDAMDRRVEVTRVRAIIREAKAAGIETGTFIMLGYPGEDKGDIKETIQHLKESDPDHFTITIAYPIKGTSLYHEVEDLQLSELDWEKTTDRDRDFKRAYPRKFYELAVRRVVNEIHFHKLRGQKKHITVQGMKKWLRFSVAKIMMLLY